jgi:hypothetical protein
MHGIKSTKSNQTYRCELSKCFKHLYDQSNRVGVDIGVKDVQKLCRFANEVHRLDVVRLFSQVVLQLQM